MLMLYTLHIFQEQMWHLDQRELEVSAGQQEEEVEQRREEPQHHRVDVQRREHPTPPCDKDKEAIACEVMEAASYLELELTLVL